MKLIATGSEIEFQVIFMKAFMIEKFEYIILHIMNNHFLAN